MKKSNFRLIAAMILFVVYLYSFVLSLWGKPLYNQTGNAGYLIAFHMLAIANYLTFNSIINALSIKALLNKAGFFLFLLHGSLVSVFPYNGYLIGGFILMAAALLAMAIKK